MIVVRVPGVLGVHLGITPTRYHMGSSGFSASPPSSQVHSNSYSLKFDLYYMETVLSEK